MHSSFSTFLPPSNFCLSGPITTIPTTLSFPKYLFKTQATSPGETAPTFCR